MLFGGEPGYLVFLAGVGGAMFLFARRRIRRRRQLVASAIGDPVRRRQAIEELSQEQVLLRLRQVRPGTTGAAAPSREEKELHLCLAELLLAEDRAADAASELVRLKGGLDREEEQEHARLAREVEIRLALDRGDAQAALARLDAEADPRPAAALLRARALATLDRSADEVWRLLSAQPRDALAEYAEKHPQEAAAEAARRILDGAGAYR